MSVRAFHIIFSTYGFWLPNDPRGSNSDYVGAGHLLKHGNAHLAQGRRSVASREHDRARRLGAKRDLLSSPVRFTSAQLDLVEQGFLSALEATRAALLAGTVLCDHTHLVLAQHPYDIERVVGQMKGRATSALRRAGHFANPLDTTPRPIWGARMRKVFLFTDHEVDRATRYVVSNPLKHNLPPALYRVLPSTQRGPTDRGEPDPTLHDIDLTLD